MKTVRFIAHILYGAALILAVGYGLTALYSAVVIAFKTPQFTVIDGGRRFAILYPFSDAPFLLGLNAFGQISTMILLIALYAVFFLLLSEVFQIFRADKWFTKRGITRLRAFYLGNFIAPSLAYLFCVLCWEVESPAELLVGLHALLGVFTFFIAAIFEQGVHLQHEQDLII